MTQYSQRKHYYISDLLELESSLQEHRVKISYRPITINQNVLSSSKEYVTPTYETPEEAFMYAKGWLDCMRYYEQGSKKSPREDKDSYEKKYNELLNMLENKRFEEDINNSRTSKEKRKSAYYEGWQSKVEELNDIEI